MSNYKTKRAGNRAGPVKRISLQEAIGKGEAFVKYFNFRGRYNVLKGSRASKKSKNTGIKIIHGMMKYQLANTLVVRKVGKSLKDSCFAELKWAANRLGVSHLWRFTTSPLEATYKPTGQKIYFRGMDDPLKITSIAVENGALCWCWVEEAYEIKKEEDFNMLDESIRGATPDGLYKQFMITFNPWSDKSWLKKKFFDVESDNIQAQTVNYMINEFLDEADLLLYEDMKINNPRRYKVAGLGDWGIVDGLVFENWEEKAFDIDVIRHKKGVRAYFGLDFGYTNDPSALPALLVDNKNRVIYVFDEIYERGLTNEMIAQHITSHGYAKEVITADSAEPKSIDRLRSLGIRRIRSARKGKDSVNHGIDKIRNYKIVVHPRCVNFMMELECYCWDTDQFGNFINKPIDEFNHLMDAMRYALERLDLPSLVSFG